MRNPVSGVYAIQGPNGVYIGESGSCWSRNTLGLAMMLGLECGVIRELPNASRLERVRAEAEVAKIFTARGMPVLSRFLGYSWPQQYRGLVTQKEPYVHPKNTTVTYGEDGRQIIRTTPRKAEAILLTLSGMPMAEVGRQFGVTRERIRQYMKDAGLSGKDRKIIRPLSERGNRWIGIPERQRQQHARMKARSRERVLRAVEIVRTFVVKHGRAPIHAEVADALGLHGQASPTLISYFKRGGEMERRAIRRLNFVYHTAGIVGPRPRGTNSHRDGGKSVIRALSEGRKRWWATMTPEQRTAWTAKMRARLEKSQEHS